MTWRGNSRLHQQVFLIEINQLGDSDPQRSVQLRKDIQTFLGLKQPLKQLLHTNSLKQTEARVKVKRHDVSKIDICNIEYGVSTYSRGNDAGGSQCKYMDSWLFYQ